MEEPARPGATAHWSTTHAACWLSSLGLVDTQVWQVPFARPLTPELAWDLVLVTAGDIC